MGSRPHTSNDNRFSEVQFKTLKYQQEFPRCFETIDEARAFCRRFSACYSEDHPHAGIGLMTPDHIHFGQADDIYAARQATVHAAFLSAPERFVRQTPKPPKIPTAVWINPPKNTETMQTRSQDATDSKALTRFPGGSLPVIHLMKVRRRPYHQGRINAPVPEFAERSVIKLMPCPHRSIRSWHSASCGARRSVHWSADFQAGEKKGEIMGVLDRMRLDGKRVFMTGGSRGLGREMALGLAEVGADITMVARSADSLEATAADIRALGRNVTTIVGDMSNPEACEATCLQVLADGGTFDILVNNIGGRRLNVPLEEMPLDQWQQMIDLNLTSTFLCCKHFGGAMIRRGQGGRVINLASINAMVAGRNIQGRHYEAAKAGVLMLTRSLAVDWAQHGITVNAICPGIFATDPNKLWAQKNPAIINAYIETIPMGKLGEPEDLAALAVYLASDAARYMTGAALVIDGGYTCL